MKGGTGAAIIPFLKKVGFVASDGAPTDIYKTFRSQAKSGAAAAAAVRAGYAPLGQVNEAFFKLNDQDLKDVILQVTGAAADNSAAKHTLATLKTLMGYAEFKEGGHARIATEEVTGAEAATKTPSHKSEFIRLENPDRGAESPSNNKVGLNLSYTINLNLPATTDQAVFNAIFKSLREHLLSSDD